jgi:hypothetical protein
VNQTDRLNQDRLIDAAIQSYPLESLPSGFAKKTMHRLAPRSRFHLEFLDLAIPTFLAFCTAMLGVSVIWITRQADFTWLSGALPLVEAYAQTDEIWLLVAAAMVILGGLFLLALIVIAWLETPFRLMTGISQTSQVTITLKGNRSVS